MSKSIEMTCVDCKTTFYVKDEDLLTCHCPNCESTYLKFQTPIREGELGKPKTIQQEALF